MRAHTIYRKLTVKFLDDGRALVLLKMFLNFNIACHKGGVYKINISNESVFGMGMMGGDWGG